MTALAHEIPTPDEPGEALTSGRVCWQLVQIKRAIQQMVLRIVLIHFSDITLVLTVFLKAVRGL